MVEKERGNGRTKDNGEQKRRKVIKQSKYKGEKKEKARRIFTSISR